ncbi:hypothetical protein [Algoriphagus hitonicola]|uniref:Uncharacterized protein n=1 Tax=Algoriphagus hitonicola TaxID=435880 RepID=A0A1I2TSQ1_9BACT|nr:hypothetical protein [Algoriphagus hitonicola]SFG67888.1 hypothetical protein SAMN04487988_106190 [Algoriphagus hitonicola]
MLRFFLLQCLFISAFASVSFGQTADLDSLKQTILQFDEDLYQVELNLHQSQKQLKTGIFIATVGYTVTIVGGQLLGRNPSLGETLLYAGGATGIVGTFVLVDGFKKISLRKPSRRLLGTP